MKEGRPVQIAGTIVRSRTCTRRHAGRMHWTVNWSGEASRWGRAEEEAMASRWSLYNPDGVGKEYPETRVRPSVGTPEQGMILGGWHGCIESGSTSDRVVS